MGSTISNKIDAVSDRLESIGMIKEALWLDVIANTVEKLSSIEEEKKKVIEDVHRAVAPYGVKINEEETKVDETPKKTLKINVVFQPYHLKKDDLKSFMDTALPTDGAIGVSSLYFDFKKEGMSQLTPDQLKPFVERQVPKTLRVKGVAIEDPEAPFGVMVDTETNMVDYRDMAVLLKSKYFSGAVVTGMSMEIPFKSTREEEEAVR